MLRCCSWLLPTAGIRVSTVDEVYQEGIAQSQDWLELAGFLKSPGIANAGLCCFVCSWCGSQEDEVAFSNFPELKFGKCRAERKQ